MVQVRIDDCIKALKEYVELGKTFDYVVNDLTDIPINVSLQGECDLCLDVQKNTLVFADICPGEKECNLCNLCHDVQKNTRVFADICQGEQDE